MYQGWYHYSRACGFTEEDLAGRTEVPRICKKHFVESDYFPNSNKLRQTAVPSLFLPGVPAPPEVGAEVEVPVGAEVAMPVDGAAAAVRNKKLS